MPWKSRWTCDIPILSVPGLLFESPTAPLSDDRPLLIDADKPDRYFVTHHGYRLWSKRFAAGLRKAGVRPGDRLLLFSGNTLFFPVVLQGAIMAGAIFTGANPTYVGRELAYQLSDSGATILIAAEGSLDTALEAIQIAGFPRERLFVFDDGYATFDGEGKGVQGLQHWSRLLASEREGDAFEWEPFTTREQMNAIAVLNYSSGTTGVPKGVEITHMNVVSNCLQSEYMAKLSPAYEEKRRRAVSLAYLPLYHTYGQSKSAIQHPREGYQVYIMHKFDFLKLLQYTEKYRVTSLNLVPPVVVAMTKRPEVKQYDLSSVESAGCGAAPLGIASKVDFEGLWPQGAMTLFQGWGMTEITCSATGFDPNGSSSIGSSSVGELLPNVEAMIVDVEASQKGEVREVDYTKQQTGELWVRGPNVMKGYWRKPEATKETLTPDGWLKTGDVMSRDEDGLLYVVDRTKELIKVKGNQVAPAELEAVLLGHPAIADAGVVGVTMHGDERPRAYVVLKDGHRVSPGEIASWLAKRVAPIKRLTGGVRMVGEIAKNPSGKILRRRLKDLAKEEVGDGVPKESRL